MLALALSLVLATPPVDDSLVGAPPTNPPLSADDDGPVTLPPRWYLERDWFETTAWSAELFASRTPAITAPSAGVACELTTPDSFALSRHELRTADFPVSVMAPAEHVFVPTQGHALSRPRLEVWRSETANADPVGEVILGVMTAGLSLLRLTPTLVATIAPEGKGPFRAHCHAVSPEAVDAVIASDRFKTWCAKAAGWACVHELAALKGLHDPDVLARAQLIVRHARAEARQWRAQSTWQLSSLTVLGVEHCGATCLKMKVRNDAPFPQELFHANAALDADGAMVLFDFDGFPQPIPAGQTRTLRATAKRADGSAPTFPVVVRNDEDVWFARVPGATVHLGFAMTLGASRCEGTDVLVPVTTQRLAGGESPFFDAWFADGSHSHFTLPFAADAGDAKSYSEKCRSLIAVSSRASSPAYVLLP